MRVRSIVHSAVLLLLVALATAAGARAQTPPATSPAPAKVNYAYRYRLLGVYDELSGDPLVGVEVSDVLGGSKSLTTATGTVSLLFLPEGGSLVRLRKVGYEVQTFSVAISPADTTPITIIMKKATQLPTVVITDSAPKHNSAGLRSFEEHKKNGFGQFLGEDYLRKNDNRSLAQSLGSRLVGAHLIVGRAGASYLVSSRKPCSGPALRRCNVSDCYVRVYLDGIQIYDNSTLQAQVDASRLSTSDYAGVEFYPGGDALPAGISPLGGDCGTLLLHTRER